MNIIHDASFEQGAFYRNLVETYGSPLLVLDACRVHDQYQALKQALPGVELFYAIKSLPHPAILRLLADMGAGFDMASSGEIALVRQLRVSSRRTIHSHPIKRDSDIRGRPAFRLHHLRGGQHGRTAQIFTIQNTGWGFFLRISFRSKAAVVDLSKKFGCAAEEASEFLGLAARLGIHIKGLCFHVGSQCADAARQVEAIDACNTLIRCHHSTGAAPGQHTGHRRRFSPLPTTWDRVNIDGYCAPIRQALEALPSYVSVIAEPGALPVGTVYDLHYHGDRQGRS